MSKIYFEMNEKERQLHLIANNIDYAICAFGIGISGFGEYNIPTEEVIELQRRISKNLLEAYGDIDKLLKAVKEKEDEEEIEEVEKRPSVVLHEVSGEEDIKELLDCKVYCIEDVENKKENFYGTEIVFEEPKTKRQRTLLVNEDGGMSMSQWY